MVWSSSARKKRFNPDWPRVRAMILEVDHKVRNPEHDDDRPENLWVLCQWHHQRKTEGESAEVRREKGRSRREKRWYSHPAFK